MTGAHVVKELRIRHTHVIVVDDSFRGRTQEDIDGAVRELSRRILEYAAEAVMEQREERGGMSYFRECPLCGAHLDPGERCDCGDRERAAGPEAWQEEQDNRKPASALARSGEYMNGGIGQ